MKLHIEHRDIIDLRPPQLTRMKWDTWSNDVPAYIPPLRPGPIKMVLKHTVIDRVLDAWSSQEPQDVVIEFDDARYSFKGLVRDVSINSTPRGYPQAVVNIVVCGGVQIDTLLLREQINCRCTYEPVIKEKDMARCITTSKTGIEIPKERKEIKDRQFYIGSKQIFPDGNNPDWAHGTIEDAEAHAQKLIEETGEDQFIVKIIRVVRKRPTPVDIEKV